MKLPLLGSPFAFNFLLFVSPYYLLITTHDTEIVEMFNVVVTPGIGKVDPPMLAFGFPTVVRFIALVTLPPELKSKTSTVGPATMVLSVACVLLLVTTTYTCPRRSCGTSTVPTTGCPLAVKFPGEVVFCAPPVVPLIVTNVPSVATIGVNS